MDLLYHRVHVISTLLDIVKLLFVEAFPVYTSSSNVRDFTFFSYLHLLYIIRLSFASFMKWSSVYFSLLSVWGFSQSLMRLNILFCKFCSNILLTYIVYYLLFICFSLIYSSLFSLYWLVAGCAHCTRHLLVFDLSLTCLWYPLLKKFLLLVKYVLSINFNCYFYSKLSF